MADSITFKYILTEGDAVRMLRFLGTHSKLLWCVVGFFALMFSYSLLVNFLSVMQGLKDWNSLLRTFLIFASLGGAWGALIWFSPVWTAKRWPAVGVEREVTVSAEGITMRSPLSYSENAWANYTGVLETDEFFLLRMGRANTLAIPKRDLAAISAVSDFREFLRRIFTDYRRA